MVVKLHTADESTFSAVSYTHLMYSGNRIDLEQLMAGSPKWDRDHIYPQSRIKDDSLDNLVLVDRNINAKKSNEMLSPEIQRRQKAWWAQLLKMGFISKKKYDRLTRTGEFTEEELAGFISRQLVETRQSTKVVVGLLGRLFKDSRIIQVKAGVISQFRRQDLNMLKLSLIHI